MGGGEHPTGDSPLPPPSVLHLPPHVRPRSLALARWLPRLLAAALLPCAHPSSFPLPRLLTAALLLLPLHCCCCCSCCCCYCRAHAVLVLARSRSRRCCRCRYCCRRVCAHWPSSVCVHARFLFCLWYYQCL